MFARRQANRHSSKDCGPSQGVLVSTATTNIDDAAAARHAGATGQGNNDGGGSAEAEEDGYATGSFYQGDDFVLPVQRVNPAVSARATQRATVAATTASGSFEYMALDSVGAVPSATAQEGETFDGFSGPSQEASAEGASRRSTLVEVEVFDDFEDEEGAYVTSLAQLAKVLLGIAAPLRKHAVANCVQQRATLAFCCRCLCANNLCCGCDIVLCAVHSHVLRAVPTPPTPPPPPRALWWPLPRSLWGQQPTLGLPPQMQANSRPGNPPHSHQSRRRPSQPWAQAAWTKPALLRRTTLTKTQRALALATTSQGTSALAPVGRQTRSLSVRRRGWPFSGRLAPPRQGRCHFKFTVAPLSQSLTPCEIHGFAAASAHMTATRTRPRINGRVRANPVCRSCLTHVGFFHSPLIFFLYHHGGCHRSPCRAFTILGFRSRCTN